MLKKSASVVLAPLRGSTNRNVRLASSPAGAALDGHFEHPAGRYCASTISQVTVGAEHKLSFPHPGVLSVCEPFRRRSDSCRPVLTID